MLFLLQLIALCAALFSVRASPTFFQPVGSEAWRQFIPPLLLNAIILASIVLYAVAEIAFLLVLYRWTKDDEKSRKTDTLSHYLRNLGFGEQLSSHIATCWYHFKVEHRDPPIALDERRLRTRTGVLLKDEYVGAMNDRRQVKCPTCGKRVWSYSRSWLFFKWLRWSKGSVKSSGNWTERDVALALGALSHCSVLRTCRSTCAAMSRASNTAAQPKRARAARKEPAVMIALRGTGGSAGP